MNEDWNYMLDFVDELLKHAEEHSRNDNRNWNMSNYVSERISIIHFDHALELFMKAYLMKKGYLIYEVKQGKIKDGIKRSTSIIEIMHKDKTLGFTDILELFSKTSELPSPEKTKIEKFHKLRNEIQHRALDSELPMNKGEKIEDFKPIIRSVYGMACSRNYPL
jgi:hypothetical protein